MNLKTIRLGEPYFVSILWFLASRTAQKELFKNAQKTTPRILADAISGLNANLLPPILAMESFCGSESH